VRIRGLERGAPVSDDGLAGGGGGAGPDRPRGPGLQAERTELSWQRTALSAGLGCAVVALTSIREGDPVLAFAAAALGVATVASATLPSAQAWLARESAPWRLLVATASVVIGLGAIGTAMAVVHLVR
jgi:hypothetical protein